MGRRDGAAMVAVAALAVLLAAAATVPAATATGSPAEGIQPLSKIAIHKTVIRMNPSAYVRATPTLLGEKVVKQASYFVASFLRNHQHDFTLGVG
jgi:acid phosphatase type 7